ncbi:hypothetical protein KUTeg_016914 [Tegillarca granosa]|uniref:ATP-dependent DNA helicase n=1 Tax=Tegillarca granosa TaxID=220873 RepID=A0ABQ9EMD0_TEGGR|nr:hypothetical protein KUTeg_016914 [Tegillarca granosa]
MLSRKLFEQLEFICRQLKNKFKVFGGMQVIAIGDFFQLAPVPDEMKVLRQKQLDFVEAVNDVSKGELTVETCNLIKRLHRSLPPSNGPIRLSARKFDCLIYNACKLMDLPGEDYVFNAIDTTLETGMSCYAVKKLI